MFIKGWQLLSKEALIWKLLENPDTSETWKEFGILSVTWKFDDLNRATFNVLTMKASGRKALE